MIRDALDQAGGAAYLLEQSKANPTAFMTLVGKLVPLEAKVQSEVTLTLETLILKSLEGK